MSLEYDMRQTQCAIRMAELVREDVREGPCLACRSWTPWYPDTLGKVEAVRLVAELGPLAPPALHVTHALLNQLANLAGPKPELTVAEFHGLPVCVGKSGTRDQLAELLQAELLQAELKG